MQPELPPGVSLQMVRDDSTFIRDSIDDVKVTMILGGLLTVLIVFLFLNSWRSTVITGLTLPISVIAAFIAMRMFGFTLNVLTLMGLSLAIGMLIDDAIVVRENIVRHMQQGKDHFDAARDGTAEIGLAVMATTFTIVAVFIPVAFMGGMVGQFFYEFGITVAAAVLVSLFVSFTLDPMLSSRWVRPGRRRGPAARLRSAALLQRFNRWFDSLHGSYERMLDWSLRHRWVVVGGRARRVRQRASRFSPCWAATSCPTSTAASTRSRSRRRRARRCARPASARRRWCARLRELPGRRIHLHDDRRGGHAVPAGHRRHDLREAEGAHGQDLQRGAARGARRRSSRCRA